LQQKLESMLQQYGDTSATSDLPRLWRGVQILLTDCMAMNDINAHVAHRVQSCNQQLLRIIKGEDVSPGLYGADATARSLPAASSIARA